MTCTCHAIEDDAPCCCPQSEPSRKFTRDSPITIGMLLDLIESRCLTEIAGHAGSCERMIGERKLERTLKQLIGE